MEVHKLVPSLLRKYRFELAYPKNSFTMTCHFFVHPENIKCFVSKR
jgi:hypothetical protein